MRPVILVFILVAGLQNALAQPKQVAITIDDIPNVSLIQRTNFSSLLLKRIDSLSLPVAIFINEYNIKRTTYQKENLDVLNAWITNKNITAGNHAFSHLNYADTTFAAFQKEVKLGEEITRHTLGSMGKQLVYFRFPYNSLGKDKEGHEQIEKFLVAQGYIIAPFTIESEDWMYSVLYEDALNNNDLKLAHQIGQDYVSFTLKLFDYFEQLCLQRFGRNIRHIYLCHDNALNTDYLSKLVDQLSKRKHSFIGLEQALQDPIYRSPDMYYGKYGFSWIYRWEADGEKRKKLMQGEPENSALYSDYNKLISVKRK